MSLDIKTFQTFQTCAKSAFKILGIVWFSEFNGTLGTCREQIYNGHTNLANRLGCSCSKEHAIAGECASGHLQKKKAALKARRMHQYYYATNRFTRRAKECQRSRNPKKSKKMSSQHCRPQQSLQFLHHGPVRSVIQIIQCCS